MKEGYIPQKDRKKILFLCDDIRMHSGVATMAREIVVGTAHRYNWVNVGAAINHPEVGKRMDLSADTNKHTGIDDSSVILYPQNGYGTPELLRYMLQAEKPDAIFFFTDPRYYEWLFNIEHELRQRLPLIYLNIWDDLPAPLYNKSYYNSCNTLLGISKQTKNINELVLGEDAKDKLIKYVPHGINQNTFFPITPEYDKFPQFTEFKQTILGGKNFEFLVFFNSRNIQRKHPADTMLAFKIFCDKIGPEKAKRCALVMKTEIVSQHGTDLKAVKEAICPDYVNVFFSTEKLTPAQMNLLYNIADVNMLISSNEGWGLANTEALITGTMNISTVTGGMQDQMRFVDDKGEWFTPSPDIPSNHRGTYKKHGEWVEPVFPSNISMMGSPLTPYIFDDRVQPEDAAEALLNVYNLGKEERDRRGMEGHKWVHSDESNMTAQKMGLRIIDAMEEGFKQFTPRPLYEITKVGEKRSKFVEHKLTGY